MLSGIKKGKRKRKNDGGVKKEAIKKPSSSVGTTTFGGKSNGSNSSNQNAAEELRKLLAGGKPLSAHTTTTTTTAAAAATPSTTYQNSVKSKSAIDRFEQRRGGGVSSFSTSKDDNEETIIISSNNTNNQAPILSKEDFRRGARKGKVKQTESYMRSSADLTIAQMVEEEKKSKQNAAGNQSMDETFARNIQRLGSRYKGSDFKMVAGSTAGADEDDGTSMDMKMFTNVADRLTDAERYNREVSRQMAFCKKQNSIANKCWWWIESEMFQKHRLIALGDHVSFDFLNTSFFLRSYYLLHILKLRF